MSNPQMTVRQLREALAKIDRMYDDIPVVIWLPGSRIDLHQFMGSTVGNNGELLIEGNLREGSALSS